MPHNRRVAKRKVLSLILVLFLSSLLIGALDSLLSSIAIGWPSKGVSSVGGVGGEGGAPSPSSASQCLGGEGISVDCCTPPHIPLFELLGAPRASYLRVSVGEVYRSGSWDILNASLRTRYQGELIEQTVTSYARASHVKFHVVPLVAIEGFIPSAKNPLKLSLFEGKCDLYYYPSQQIFFLKGGTRSNYSVEYVKYEFDERELASASVSSDPKYLDVPQELLPLLKPLAEEIVKTYRAKTPFEKLKAIEAFLRDNYVYDENYTRTPSGHDPVLWFLFHEKRGVCGHFNSAFVLLARTLGLPTRLVVGYLVDPDESYQVVYADKAHAYAEALFDGFGWITFDATGGHGRASEWVGGVSEISGEGNGGGLVRTTTEISYIDEIGIKGSTFRVSGKVLDEHGSAVSGLLVKVYLKRDKNDGEPGVLVGQGVVKSGSFDITCLIPLNITVGDYFVIAETIGGGRYLGSRSDPQVKVVAKTYISASCPEKAIAGRSFRISGFLREVGSDSPIEKKSVILVCASKEYRVLTNDEGGFSIDISIHEPGDYVLTLKFDGAEYYLGSTCEMRLRALNLGITPLTKSTLIRGEDVDIAGIVHAEELVGDNEVVEVYFNGLQVARVKTDTSGHFSAKYYVPRDHALGESTFKYCLQSNGFKALQKVIVMARTHMSVRAPEEPVESGKPFTIAVTLLNDLEEPIPYAPIVLNLFHQGCEYSASSTTNERGVALFNLSLPTDREGLANYRVTFPGNELYLSAELAGEVKVVPSRGYLSYYYMYLPLAVIAIGSSFLVRFLRRRGPPRRKTAPEGGAGAQETTPATYPAMAKKSVDLAIKFPTIEESFPPVWGLNEKLPVRVEIKRDDMPICGATITLKVNEKEIIYLKSSPNGDAEVQLTFTEKGLHKLRAHFAGNSELNEATAEASIKIVDYREEIVDLFNSFIKSASAKRQGLGEVMTAREIQYKLLKELPESKHGYLEDLVSIFEVANYSLRPITRADYEKFFLAKLNLEA